MLAKTARLDDMAPPPPALRADHRGDPRPVALIVAHGSPAEPLPQEATLMALAVRVGMWAPGWRVRGTTLALPGALETALARDPRAVILPFFMAEGWFTRKQLPKRLSAADWQGTVLTAAFGHAAGMVDLAARAALQGAAAHGIAPATATLILAAHGSQVSRASATRTEELAAALRAATPFAQIVTGYVEEPPFLAEVAADVTGPALVLPFFATRAGHVADDLPEALAEARFSGPLLPAIGEHADAARLLAAMLDSGLES